ncbi:class I SAM-dependent methyltransferase [Sulfitobacter sp. JB4-11]|uniref:class I SAM-dependent methyltransferase n=1 Tax=Sulfitobacter rhodophyticola TaxID=3238304 RepID=UPI0035137606
MPQDSYQLASSAAHIYEDQKVKAIFGPLARATLNTISLSAGDRVLDVACGTGIVARSVRDRYGTDVAVTGTDLNDSMIETARMLTSDLVPPIEWVVADATAMPFADGTFSVCMCQQGLQFVPDKRAAIEEFRRVLEPNGRLVISIWAGASPFFTAMAEALARHVSADVAALSLAPFAYQAQTEVPPLLSAAGFGPVSVQTIAIDRVIEEPETDIPKEIFGNPVGPSVKEKGEETLARIVGEIRAACVGFEREGSLVIPQSAYLITAQGVK